MPSPTASPDPETDTINAAIELKARISEAAQIGFGYGGTDGAHHKWVIDQMLREMLGDEYDEWVAAWCELAKAASARNIEWDVGLAPDGL